MIRVAIIVGSTRPGRNGKAVADWVYRIAIQRRDAEYKLVDIADFELPLLDETIPPRMGQYSKTHTKVWAAEIDSFDAFVFVTPEYNHSTSAALKNAIDYLFREWHNKAAGFVSYGADKGVRAVEHLRQILGEVAIADVRAKVALSLRSDFENFSTFKPRDFHIPLLNAMLDEVVVWGEALSTVRNKNTFTSMGQPHRPDQRAFDETGPDRNGASWNGDDDARAYAVDIATRWTDALSRRDVEGLLGLYHPDIILENPVTYALGIEPPGIRHGLGEVRELFEAVVARTPAVRRFHRTPPLTDGHTFMWENQRGTSDGDLRDFVEVMELDKGLIRRHRFYWGWYGVGVIARNEYHR